MGGLIDDAVGAAGTAFWNNPITSQFDSEAGGGVGDYAVDAGETAGGQGSTVVDVAAETIHRRGPLADDIEAWLQERA